MKEGDFINPAVTEFLHKESTYKVKNQTFLVTSVFRETGKETFGDVLFRLMRCDTEKTSQNQCL